jgi:hypothetical protein
MTMARTAELDIADTVERSNVADLLHWQEMKAFNSL